MPSHSNPALVARVSLAWSARPWICLLTNSSIGQCSNDVSKASTLSQLTSGRCWLSSLCRCPIAGERSPSLGIFIPLDISISLPGCLSSCGVMGQTMAADLQPYTSCLEEGDPTSQLRPSTQVLRPLGTPPDVSSRMGSTDSF